MKLIDSIKNHINGRYEIDYDILMTCLDDECIRLLRKYNYNLLHTIDYIESGNYKIGFGIEGEDLKYIRLFELIENGTHDKKTIEKWVEELLGSIKTDELSEYLQKRYEEIRREDTKE